jgi:UDP-3-O-[3-hydroxymyristoyl] glucosamine N-acyltransferase
MVQIGLLLQWAKENGYVFSFEGNEHDEISGFSSLKEYRPGTMAWAKRAREDDSVPIKLVIQLPGVELASENRILTESPKSLFFDLVKAFFISDPSAMAEKAGSYIGSEVEMEENVRIGCNCVLDGKIRIGSGTVIESSVTIMHDVTIGHDCVIHSGTVIGKDGFGFVYDEDRIPQKVAHYGGVIIGDRVEIGANCTVDRGSIDPTVIGDDVKIDSLCLIAHNVKIGRGTLIIGCTSLGGSTSIGEKSYIGPHVFVKNQMSVGSNSLVGMGVIVNKPVGDDTILASNDLRPMKMKDYRRLL